ncbi:hypothetical protein TREES_T100011581 [Tupaia chinensis]|uniref:Uncharacterized protein n=1 Tax=Tupaia chinensis TaxID=246437 RepID=L9L7Y0_TUPCH|nr:hypothetical protein TREES_T100011581 [Tupaia chinensis]
MKRSTRKDLTVGRDSGAEVRGHASPPGSRAAPSELDAGSRIDSGGDVKRGVPPGERGGCGLGSVGEGYEDTGLGSSFSRTLSGVFPESSSRTPALHPRWVSGGEVEEGLVVALGRSLLWALSHWPGWPWVCSVSIHNGDRSAPFPFSFAREPPHTEGQCVKDRTGVSHLRTCPAAFLALPLPTRGLPEVRSCLCPFSPVPGLEYALGKCVFPNEWTRQCLDGGLRPSPDSCLQLGKRW